MLKLAHFDDAFLEVFLTTSKPSRMSITAAKEKKRRKKEGEKKIPIIIIEKPKDVGHFLLQKSQNFDFCTCPCHSVVKRDVGGQNCKLLCCKCIFDGIKANLAEIQLKKHRNLQKTPFLQKVPGVNGLRMFTTVKPPVIGHLLISHPLSVIHLPGAHPAS